MNFFNPARNFSITRKIFILLLIASFFALLHASLLAWVTNFAPKQAIKLPFMTFSVAIIIALIYFCVSSYKKHRTVMTYNPYSGKSKGEIVAEAFAIGLVLSLVTYASLVVTYSDIYTRRFGKPYNAIDVVTNTEKCHSRGCSCTYQLLLRYHDQGISNEFCLNNSEWLNLKAGKKVMVVGRSSFLGVSIESFQAVK